MILTTIIKHLEWKWTLIFRDFFIWNISFELRMFWQEEGKKECRPCKLLETPSIPIDLVLSMARLKIFSVWGKQVLFTERKLMIKDYTWTVMLIGIIGIERENKATAAVQTSLVMEITLSFSASTLYYLSSEMSK